MYSEARNFVSGAGQDLEGAIPGVEESGGAAIKLVGVWVDQQLEEQAEIACCLLYYFLQYLLADDGIDSLQQGQLAPTHVS